MSLARTLGCLLLGGLAVVPESHSAAEVDLFSMTPVYPGARAAGMGGAYEAVSDDWTAAFWNPAGLARLRRVELSGSFSMARRENSVSVSSDGRATDGRNSYVALDHLGYAMPVPTYRGSLVFGIGYARMQDFRLPYALREGSSRFEVDEEGSAGAVAFSAAAQLARPFHGGVSLLLLGGHDDYLFTATDGGETESGYSEMDLSGWALKFGGLYHPVRQLWLGASLRTPLQLAVDSDGYEYDFSLPAELGLSAAWQEYGWLLGVSAHLADASQASYDGLSGGQDLVLNREVSRGYRTQTRLAAGGEYQLPGTDLRLRGGLWTRSLAQNDRLITEPVEGGTVSRWNYREEDPVFGWSLGAGVLFDEVVALDLAWQQERGSFSWQDQAGPDVPAVRITEQPRSRRLTMTLNVRL